MFIILDNRPVVSGVFSDGFGREGVTSTGISPVEFQDWFQKVSKTDIDAVEAFLIGDCEDRTGLSKLIRQRSRAPLLCLNDRASLDDTLGLFAAGVDDVVRKPIHPREILARVGAINRRARADVEGMTAGPIQVFFDGRDPEIDGQPIALPRRERRILEHLVKCKGRRATKTQIFNAIYGLFDEEVDEAVVESHISKLRAKLRRVLGRDPIDSKRFLGYRLDLE